MWEGAETDLRCVSELGIHARVSDAWQVGQSGLGKMDRPLAEVIT
jgi:hypothetical protein